MAPHNLGGNTKLVALPFAHSIRCLVDYRPSLILARLWTWMTARGANSLWPHLAATLWATFLGFVVGVGTGFAAGLFLGQSRRVAAIARPFIVAVNSLPRIAMVPLITMFFGLGVTSKVVMAWFIVFFAVFFNSFQGAREVDRTLVDNSRILGATRWQLMRSVILPSTEQLQELGDELRGRMPPIIDQDGRRGHGA